MTARTPGPWYFTGDGDRILIREESSDGVIARMDDGGRLDSKKPMYKQREVDANAKFIVKACNAHDALVAALAALLGAVQSNHAGGAPKTADDIFAEAGRQAIAALALARGVQS